MSFLSIQFLVNRKDPRLADTGHEQRVMKFALKYQKLQTFNVRKIMKKIHRFELEDRSAGLIQKIFRGQWVRKQIHSNSWNYWVQVSANRQKKRRVLTELKF